MLISDKTKKKRNLKKLLFNSLAFAIIIVPAIYFLYPKALIYSSLKNKNIIHCDAEKVYKKSFLSNGSLFSSGNTQSNEFAHQGQFSSKLSKSDEPQYGIGYELKNLEAGSIYEASIWVKKQKTTAATLVFAGLENSKFYKASNELGEVENGFEKISMTVQIPKPMAGKTAKVYVYSDGKSKVYCDDLMIQKLDSLPKQFTTTFDPPHLQLDIKEKNYQKLQAKIKEAQNAGVLISKEDDWVNANLIDEENIIPVKVRLKGDWLDHLQGDKWSFRIKGKGVNTWNRMTTFSVHTPAARYYALEWLVHQFWEREDVLTTRYDFINLSVNGKHLGTYAYEEHFEKQLLEYRKRREGPIIRFSENALWDVRSRQINTGVGGKKIHSEEAAPSSAPIKPFKAGKIQASEVLSQQYKIAQNLLYQYQEGLKLAEEIFDMEQMAKYTAIIDLFGAHHGLVWHNQRFYYNPVTSLLEPIGFDGFATQPWAEPLVLGKEQLESSGPFKNGPLRRLYNNEIFIEKYMQFLNQYTDEDYLNTFFNETSDAMQARVDFLKEEFPNFKYDQNRILNRANQIRFRMYPFQKHSIRANWELGQTASGVLLLSNSHELPLQIIGTGSTPTRPDFNLETPTTMPAFRLGNPKIIQKASAPSNAKYVFYKPFGIDTLFSSPIDLFQLPNNEVPRQTLFKNKKLTPTDIYEVRDHIIIFKKGSFKTKEDIIIPSGYQVIFEAGFSLDLFQKAKFISQSPVFLNGTNDDPIQIYSSDQSANGFTVLQSKETSNINFSIFSDLNTLSYKGWNLTGAVTFYESEVIIKNTKIIDNHCEDALNIVRSQFDINGLQLINPAFDGFDADFCSGRIDNSSIFKAGNDGLDFSGSNILINECKIVDAGDKGISAGEESRITVNNTTIDGAVIGAASKDLSYLRIKKILLKNCNQGFAAYQKKPEYGRSSIFVESYGAENVKYLHTIAPRCTLQIDGYFVIGE